MLPFASQLLLHQNPLSILKFVRQAKVNEARTLTNNVSTTLAGKKVHRLSTTRYFQNPAENSKLTYRCTFFVATFLELHISPTI